MNKLYSVHDHWTDINKKNDVDIESIDGVITGIKVNGEDYGGGITWESVYSGTIDPDGEVRPFTADVSLTMTASDTIKVVYDNTEYILPKQIINEHICYGATAYSIPESIDFSNCPFLIQVMPNTIRVYTETAGTHTLTISEPASGGETWDTVFEGNVTTEQSEMGNVGRINYNEQLTADTLKITFDGIEYECKKISTITSNMYGGVGENGPDFSEYPFAIMSTEDGNQVFTKSVGTHSLKIESSESGGNFNVAELTVVNNTSTVRSIYAPITLENGTTSGLLNMPNMGAATVNVILGDEGCFIEFDTTSMVIECSGGISRQTSKPNTFRMRDTATITIVRIED